MGASVQYFESGLFSMCRVLAVYKAGKTASQRYTGFKLSLTQNLFLLTRLIKKSEVYNKLILKKIQVSFLLFYFPCHYTNLVRSFSFFYLAVFDKGRGQVSCCLESLSCNSLLVGESEKFLNIRNAEM